MPKKEHSILDYLESDLDISIENGIRDYQEILYVINNGVGVINSYSSAERS